MQQWSAQNAAIDPRAGASEMQQSIPTHVATSTLNMFLSWKQPSFPGVEGVLHFLQPFRCTFYLTKTRANIRQNKINACEVGNEKNEFSDNGVRSPVRDSVRLLASGQRSRIYEKRHYARHDRVCLGADDVISPHRCTKSAAS
jgi:hypothetical protein